MLRCAHHVPWIMVPYRNNTVVCVWKWVVNCSSLTIIKSYVFTESNVYYCFGTSCLPNAVEDENTVIQENWVKTWDTNIDPCTYEYETLTTVRSMATSTAVTTTSMWISIVVLVGSLSYNETTSFLFM
jgi:hypothetical protein